MPRFSTGTRFLRAQRGPRPVRARLGAGGHRKGHPRPRQPHPCPALRPRPASRPVTEGTRRSALLPGRQPKSRAGAHSGANEAGPPTAVVPDGLARTPSPTKAGSAAHRQRSSQAGTTVGSSQAGTTAAPSRCGFADVRACSLLYSDGGGRRKSRTHRAPPREVASEEAARPPGLTAPCEVLFLWETGRLEAFSLTWEARLTFSEIPPQEKQKCSVPEAEFT